MRISTFILLLLSLAVGQTATAEEHFGEFRDALKGEFIDAKPRPRFKLAAQFRFIDPNGLLWSVPPQKEVDGASIPQAFWSFIGGPFEGAYIKASVIHDYYCDEKIRTAHDTHRSFYYGMRASGVEEWKAKFMYWAVETFGPNWKLDKRVRLNLRCRSSDVAINCRQEPEVKVEPVSLRGVDLGDPEILAAAFSKASAVARSLKTTNGMVLDVSSSGQVAASLDDIASSADGYRAIFMKDDYMSTPAQLGVLSKWDMSGIDQVRPWDNNRIPEYNEAITLEPSSIEQVQSGEHFKLDANSKVLLKDQLNMKTLNMDAILSR